MFLLRGLDVNGSDDFAAFDHFPTLDHFESFELAVLACANVNDVEDLNGGVMGELLLLDLSVGDVGWKEFDIAEGRGDIRSEEAEVES